MQKQLCLLIICGCLFGYFFIYGGFGKILLPAFPHIKPKLKSKSLELKFDMLLVLACSNAPGFLLAQINSFEDKII